MDRMAAAEERLLSKRLRQTIDEVKAAAKEHLAAVDDHINFTLQQAYFKCAHECFDRRKERQEISNCVEHCRVPVLQAQNLVKNETAKFQERLKRSLTVCQDKYKAAKLQPSNSNLRDDLESCIDLYVKESINLIPHLSEKMKAHLGIQD